MEGFAIKHSDPTLLFIGGPLAVLFLIACLSLLCLLFVMVGRGERLVGFGERAAARLERGRIVPTLWGLAASLLVLILSGILFQHHALALLGVFVLIAGLALAGLGLSAAALSLGQRLMETSASIEIELLPTLRLGLWVLLLTAFVPFAGWLLVLFALASGIGAVLETLVSRQPE